MVPLNRDLLCMQHWSTHHFLESFQAQVRFFLFDTNSDPNSATDERNVTGSHDNYGTLNS